jgi:hypothetical protein
MSFSPWASMRREDLEHRQKQERNYQAAKSGEVEICAQKVYGLFVVLGEPGFFVEKRRGDRGEEIKAFWKERKEIKTLRRATEDEAFKLITDANEVHEPE